MSMPTVSGLWSICSTAFILVAVAGCGSYPLRVSKTALPQARVLRGPNSAGTHVIFLSPVEAKCPTQCTTAVNSAAQYNRILSHIESRLQEKGYNLISGAIVSRVEDKLKGNRSRETWDRTEKALLLGKETGADAIFEVRSVYSDQKLRAFLKSSGDDMFVEKPKKSVETAISDWQAERPSSAWWWLPIVGWIRMAVADSPPSSYEVPVWEATVEARLIDLDGNVIWSGAKTVQTTDIMPSDWEARLDGAYPRSRVRTGKENFKYLEYYEDDELQRKQLSLIIDDLVAQLPLPGYSARH